MFNNNYSDPTIVISHANIDENILLLITLSKLKLNTSAFCSNGTCMDYKKTNGGPGKI